MQEIHEKKKQESALEIKKVVDFTLIRFSYITFFEDIIISIVHFKFIF